MIVDDVQMCTIVRGAPPDQLHFLTVFRLSAEQDAGVFAADEKGNDQCGAVWLELGTPNTRLHRSNQKSRAYTGGSFGMDNM